MDSSIPCKYGTGAAELYQRIADEANVWMDLASVIADDFTVRYLSVVYSKGGSNLNPRVSTRMPRNSLKREWAKCI